MGAYKLYKDKQIKERLLLYNNQLFQYKNFTKLY